MTHGARIPFEERSFDEPGFPDAVYSCCYHNQTIDDPADTFDHTVDHIMVSDDDPGGAEPPDRSEHQRHHARQLGRHRRERRRCH